MTPRIHAANASIAFDSCRVLSVPVQRTGLVILILLLQFFSIRQIHIILHSNYSTLATEGERDNFNVETRRGSSCQQSEDEATIDPSLVEQHPAVIQVTESASSSHLQFTDSSHDLAIYITSASRPAGVFYLKHVLEGLHQAGIEASQITVFDVEGPGKPHNHLPAYLRSQEYHNYPVRIISRSEPIVSMEEYVQEPNESKRHAMLHPFGFRISSKLEKEFWWYKQSSQDKPQRMYWRIKECLDWVYVARDVLRFHENAKWFLFLEDDMVYNGGLPRVRLPQSRRQLVAQAPFSNTFPRVVSLSKPYGIAWLAKGGSKAVLMERQMLESMIGYVALRYDYFPIDWLMSFFVRSIGVEDKDRKLIKLFEHIGKSSSLALKNNRTNTGLVPL